MTANNRSDFRVAAVTFSGVFLLFPAVLAVAAGSFSGGTAAAVFSTAIRSATSGAATSFSGERAELKHGVVSSSGDS